MRYSSINLALVIAFDLSYFALSYYSLCRCCQLRFPGTERNQGPKPEKNIAAQRKIHSLDANNEAQLKYNSSKSCYTFVSDREGLPWNEYIRSKKAVALWLVYGSSFAFLLICITNTFRQINFRNRRGPSTCFLPPVGTWIKAIAISSLTLEPLSHIAYSFGTLARSELVYRIRNVLLALIAGACVNIMFLMGSKSIRRHNGEGFFVLGVPLWSTVWKFTEISMRSPFRLSGCSNH